MPRCSTWSAPLPRSICAPKAAVGAGAQPNRPPQPRRYRCLNRSCAMPDTELETPFRCGTAVLVGRPNVGKSTLLNALIGWRLSIVGPKPQTTRHRILGVRTSERGQILFLDTPGLHRSGGKVMNRELNRAARKAIGEADVAVHVIEAGRWTAEDQLVWDALAAAGCPCLLALNKTDTQKDKKQLLPFVARLSEQHAYAGIHFVSARRREGLSELESAILQ